MRFLLVAPEDPDVRGAAGRPRDDGSDGVPVRPRPGLRFSHLSQAYSSAHVRMEEVAAPVATADASSSVGAAVATLRHLRRYRSPVGTVWTLLVEMDPPPPLAKGTAELEEDLSALAARTIGSCGGGTPLWVSRTLVDGSDRDAEDVAAWLSRADAGSGDAPPTFPVPGGEFVIGWGNCLLRGPDPEPALPTIENSLVLAQMLWAHLHSISEAAGATLTAGIALDHRRDRTGARALLADVRALTNEVALGEMLADEFTHNNQGARLAAPILGTWGFEPFRTSARRRLADLRAMADDVRTGREGRYQRTVEWILLALGMLAVLDLLIAVLQLAFSGDVDAVPGDGGRLGLLDALRAVDADASLALGVLVVAGMMIAAIALSSRRGERDR